MFTHWGTPGTADVHTSPFRGFNQHNTVFGKVVWWMFVYSLQRYTQTHPYTQENEIFMPTLYGYWHTYAF